MLKSPGSFSVFNAQICILPHSRDSFLPFLASTSTPKADRNRILDCTSINMRYFFILIPIFYLDENVMLLILGMPSEVRLENFMI